MKREIEFRKKALEDINEAIDWYEEQKKGLGAEFFDEVQKGVDKISENPELFGKRHEDIRAARTKRFPYLVYFLIKKLKILIVAVLHSSRDTKSILKNRT